MNGPLGPALLLYNSNIYAETFNERITHFLRDHLRAVYQLKIRLITSRTPRHPENNGTGVYMFVNMT